MKLCSICDKKIEGTWCKNCHRFVKTYHISEGIHFNESHNPKNDVNCTYHTDVRKSGTTANTTVTRTTGSSSSQQTYTRTTTSTGTGSASGTARSSSGKKKNGKGKLAVILIILYVVFNLIGGLVPTITSCVDSFSEEFTESFKEGFEEGLREEEQYPETPEQVDTEYEEKLIAVRQLTPVDEYAENDYVFRYYDPRDVAPLGFACDESHFEVTVPEFDEWLEEVWAEDYEVEDDMSEYYNYLYETEDMTWLSFTMYRDYYADHDVAVRVDYDTATQKLHMFGFVAEEDVDASALYYKALKEFDPDTEWTQKFFKQKLNEAFEAEGETYETVTVYSSDRLMIGAQAGDGYRSVTFYSMYE